jgi:hypothetical protein
MNKESRLGNRWEKLKIAAIYKKKKSIFERLAIGDHIIVIPCTEWENWWYYTIDI